MKIELFHSFDVSRDTYEHNINHPELLKMCDGRIPYLKARVLTESRLGPAPNQHFWKFRCEADYKIPEAARRFIGDKLGWFEESIFDRKEHLCRFRVIPDVLGNRYRCEGDQIFAEREGGGFDRIMTVELVVDILLVGRTVEKHILDKLQETYRVEYEIQREFFAELARRGGVWGEYAVTT